MQDLRCTICHDGGPDDYEEAFACRCAIFYYDLAYDSSDDTCALPMCVVLKITLKHF